ncbi:signal recognition particle protein [Enterobacteriaceae endosymbiont of Donacia bicoloricornis]|uniref:signal recognition particle protein n=1 Tax=Enterobacteriaceae endosymbiont of Donacia bicoloricornis TaxID=2675772 RepID=UPI0014498518|nr:signal recognition particle receptor subunit alpha [Enterobacteriaceae endosymbiont of Donacia bicoloricornis]QJC37902.1 signal recognition particle protein [Enterobacteriaceae endosymbiont of Donacia bicoloricornis]
MFESLSNKLSNILLKIKNYGRLTEKNIKDTLDKIYINFLEADVSLEVTKDFINKIKKEAIGKKINNNFTPGQEFIKLIHKNLIELMDSSNKNINIATQPPAIILFVGLQGVGKTTSVVKLAYFLKKKYKKKVLVASTDIYRPAAIQQLKILAQSVKINFFDTNLNISPIKISEKVLNYAKTNFYDLLIIDTAGRLHIDNKMMQEIKNISNLLHPIEILFVIDAMTGQNSINIAKKFDQVLPITGIFLTKADSDTRGGACLSTKYIIKKPIKFIGNGEKINNIMVFSPEIIATKIIGMSSELTIIENIKKKINLEKNQRIINKLKNKKTFDLKDFLEQLEQIKLIGNKNISFFLNKMKMNNIQYPTNSIMNIMNIKNSTINNVKTIMKSMTKLEKQNVDIINYSRKKRISLGSGVSILEINAILKQYNQMKLINKKMKKNNNIHKIIRYVKNFFNFKK